MSATDAAVDDWVSFLEERYNEDVLQLAERFPSDQQTLRVDVRDAIRWGGWSGLDEHTLMTDQIHEHPEETRDRAEAALARVDLPLDVDLSDAAVKFANLPTDALQFDVGDYDGRIHVGRMIGICGQVNRRSKKRPKLVEATWECERCGTRTTVPGAQQPHECQGCERQGPWRHLDRESRYVDHQLVRLQLPPEKSRGQSSEAIDVELTGDLVNTVSPGDRVTVDGILETQVEDENAGLYEFTARADAIHVEETDFDDLTVSDEQREEIESIAAEAPYETLVESVAPNIYGLDTIKLALVLQLFGGVEKQRQDGTTGRGNSHVLLVGDPGVGKTELLDYVAQIAPRSVRSDGSGSTAAGLTASAVRDDFGSGGEWTIRGGSIVQAHRGVACIDELDNMAEEDRESLNTALESQQVEVSKAGINATLPAKTKLLAAANPEYGRFDPYDPIDEQIDLPPTLISRFDLIFTLQDQPEESRDREIIDHKLDSAEVGQRRTAGEDVPEALAADHEPPVGKELFRAYVAHARELTPRLTDAAKEAIRESFLDLRLLNAEDGVNPDDEAVPVTFRKEDAIIRFAEASARVRLSNEINAEDAQRAIQLVKQSMEDVGKDPDTGEYDADVVETGSSMSQKKRRKTLRKIIESLGDEEYAGAPVDEVAIRAEDMDIEQQTALETIERMKEEGEVYEPAENHLRTT